MTEILNYLYQNIFIYIGVISCAACIITFSLSDNSTVIADNDRPLNTYRYAILSLFAATFLLALYFIVFYPMGFGHKDEIAILTSPIGAQIFAGRFFPLGHAEFNYLSLDYAKNNLEILYILPMVQIVMFTYLVDRLIWPTNLLLRAITAGSAFWLGAIVAFSNIIIPERNAIILVLLGLVFLKAYLYRPTRLSASASVLFMALSLFYKEPMFVIPCAFVFCTMVYWLSNKIMKQPYINCKITPINVGYTICIIGFVAGYFFYTFYNGAPASLYSNRSEEGFHQHILFYSTIIPIIPLSIGLVLASHQYIRHQSPDKILSITMALGALGYALVLIFLRMKINGYYFAPSLLLLVLSFALVMKNILAEFTYSTKPKFIILSGSLILATIIFNMSPYIISDLIYKKNVISQFSFLDSTLRSAGPFQSVFYRVGKSPHGTYHTAITMIYIAKSGIDDTFTISSRTGCDSWNENYVKDRIFCTKYDGESLSEYDIIIIENDHIDDISSNDFTLHSYIAPYSDLEGNQITLTVAIKIK